MSKRKSNRTSLLKHRQEYKRNQEIADRAMLRNAKLEQIIQQEENNELVTVARKFNISWEALEKLAQGLLPGSEASFLMPIEEKEETKHETQEP